MTTERLTAERTIDATPAQVFAVVADPQGQVAIDSSGMLMSAPDPRPLTVVGQTFDIRMDREALGDYPMGRYTVTNVVTKVEPDRLIEWEVTAASFPRLGHVYGYELEAVEGGTRVTSYYDWSDISDELKAANVFPIIPQTALRATLGILERVVIGGGL